MQNKRRLVYADIAKAICIVLVVVGHYFPDDHPVWYWIMRSIIYSFHMPMFMFASGLIYLATFKVQDYTVFIKKKIKRLMVPYIVVSFIIITIKLLTQSLMYVENPVTYLSYVKILYLPEAGYFLWFIWALWWIYVIIPLFNTSRKRLYLLVFSILLHFIPITFPDYFCLKQFKDMVFYFVFGCVAWEYRQNLKNLFSLSSFIYFVLFVTLHSIYLFLNIGGMLLPFIGIVFVLRLSMSIEKEQDKCYFKWLITISTSSYIIYLFHTTFEGLTKSLINKMPFLMYSSNDFLFALEALVVISVGVVGPILLDNLVLKRYKFARLLFGYSS